MNDPGLGPSRFEPDEPAARRLLAAATNGAVEGTDVVRVPLPLPARGLAGLDRLGVALESRCDEPMLVDLVLEGDGRQPPRWRFGGRETLPPYGSRTVLFPVESAGASDETARWDTVAGATLVVAAARARRGGRRLAFRVGEVAGEARLLPAGPRLTPSGLVAVLPGGVGSALDPRVLSLYARARRGSRYGVPPPHPYPRGTRASILAGSVLGREVRWPPRWRDPLGGPLDFRHFVERHHPLRTLLAGAGPEAMAFVTGFVEARPVPVGSNGGASPAWEPLSASFRLREWLFLLARGAATGIDGHAALELLLRSVWEHARHLLDHAGPACGRPLLEAAGLALAGLAFPGFAEAPRWREEGLARLAAATRLEVLPDGLLADVSPLYHAAVLEALVEVRAAAHATGVPLPQPLSDGTLARSLEGLVALSRPDGTWPAVGDAWGIDRSHRALVRYASLALGRPDLELPRPGTRHPCAPPAFTSRLFPDAGLAVLRSGWGADATVAVVRAGPRPRFHPHEDALALDVTLRGVPFVVDPGIARHDPGPLAEHARSAEAHASLLVDGAAVTCTAGALRAARRAGLARVRVSGTAGAVRVTRLVALLPDGSIAVRDRIHGTGTAQVLFSWPLAPGHAHVEADDDASVVFSPHGCGPFVLRPVSAVRSVSVALVSGRRVPPAGWVARHGRDVPAPHASFLFEAPLPLAVTWLLAPLDRGPRRA